MTDDRLPQDGASPRDEAIQRLEHRRWIGPAVLTAVVVVPVVILIFSNLEATEVSWAGFRFNQPLWVVLVVTFLAGMLGGKLGGWGWRRWRRRRKRLKEELAVLRKHAAEEDSDSDA